MSLSRQLALVAAAFAVVTAAAAAAGAANLGTALTFGQIGFLLALMALLLRR